MALINSPEATVIVVLSEVAAIWIVWRLWKSGDPLVMKIALSAIAVIPILGPLFVLWVSSERRAG